MRKNLFTLAVVALLPVAALGAGYSVPNLNPADLAMAGSRVAAQDSAAAVFANPAALARLQGLNLSLAGAMVDFRSAWTDPTGTQTPSTSEGLTKLVFAPAVYASYGFRLPNDMAAAVGAGFTVPYGGNVFWPDTWPGRFDIDSVERRIYGTYLTAALEPFRWLRLGGGLIWYRGTESFLKGMNYIGSEGTAQIATSGDALSYDLSAEIQPIDRLRVAIDYKHQGVMMLDGHAHFSASPPALGLVDQSVQHELTMPNSLGIGASYQVLPILLVTGSFTWDRYVVSDKDAFVGSSGSSVVVPRNYSNGYTYRLGVEGGPINGLKVRAGILRDIAPTPAVWMDPSIPDGDVWGASIGVAYAILPNLELNAAYFHAWFDQVQTCRVTAGQCQPNNVFPGIYDSRANIASIGVTWNWDGWTR